MKRHVQDHQEDTGRRLTSAVRSSFWILAALTCVFAATAWFAGSRHGTLGITAAAIASITCFVSSTIALVCVALTANTAQALTGTLLSMIVRTAVPFFVGIFLVQASQPLADTGLFGMVLINYLVGLTVESLAAVRMIQILGPSAVQQ